LSVYEAFNQKLAVNPGIKPLQLDSFATTIETNGQEIMYWKSDKSKELLMEAKHLTFDNDWLRYVNDQSNSSEWRARIETILNKVHNWRESDEIDAADYYHEKCILINGILSKLTVADPMYDKVLDDLVNTFEESSLQMDRPAEWYWEVLKLVHASKRDETGKAASAVRAALSRSRNGYLPTIAILMGFLN
jgi:hypothetical protein